MTHGQVWLMLYDVLIATQYLLQLFMLLHYSLILETHSLLWMLLPLCCCRLQLLQSQTFLRILWWFKVQLRTQINITMESLLKSKT